MGWESHYNNVDWTNSSSGCSWNTDHWDVTSSGASIFDPAAWANGYRPTKVRCTFSGSPSTITLRVYDEGMNKIVEDFSYTSGKEVDISFGSDDISAVSWSADVINIDVTNIEWLVGAAPGDVLKINIGDSWKEVDSIYINIGDSWEEVSEMKINIGDTWKTIF